MTPSPVDVNPNYDRTLSNQLRQTGRGHLSHRMRLPDRVGSALGNPSSRGSFGTIPSGAGWGDGPANRQS